MDKEKEVYEVMEASIAESDDDTKREHEEGVPVVLYEGAEV